MPCRHLAVRESALRLSEAHDRRLLSSRVPSHRTSIRSTAAVARRLLAQGSADVSGRLCVPRRCPARGSDAETAACRARVMDNPVSRRHRVNGATIRLACRACSLREPTQPQATNIRPAVCLPREGLSRCMPGCAIVTLDLDLGRCGSCRRQSPRPDRDASDGQ